MDGADRSEVGERFDAGGETNGDGADAIGEVEHDDGHGVADRDEVADVDEVLTVGILPCLAGLCSSASAALWCWVGFGAEPSEGAALAVQA